jgi:hypothetical protein
VRSAAAKGATWCGVRRVGGLVASYSDISRFLASCVESAANLSRCRLGLSCRSGSRFIFSYTNYSAPWGFLLCALLLSINHSLGEPPLHHNQTTIHPPSRPPPPIRNPHIYSSHAPQTPQTNESFLAWRRSLRPQLLRHACGSCREARALSSSLTLTLRLERLRVIPLRHAFRGTEEKPEGRKRLLALASCSPPAALWCGCHERR